MSDVPKGKVALSRIAFRDEGEFWNAYFAPSHETMKGAILMGSIRLSLCGRKGDPVYEGFYALMQTAFEEMAESLLGERPTWHNARPAPESERSGNT